MLNILARNEDNHKYLPAYSILLGDNRWSDPIRVILDRVDGKVQLINSI